MTEAEWLNGNDPYKILRHAFKDDNPEETRNRKAILFAASCCLHIRMPSRSRVEKEAIRWLLAKADGEAEMREKEEILWSLERASQRRANDRDALMAIHTSVSETRISNFYAAVFLVAKRIAFAVAQGDKAREEIEGRIHCRFIRDIFGNPFRPVILDPSWRTEAVVALSEGIYTDKAFERMPVLADALEDAGCSHEDILSHCRSAGPHVKGCWVVDLLTGRK